MLTDLPPPFGLRLPENGGRYATFATPTGNRATSVDLCIFPTDGPDAQTEVRIPLTRRLGTTWWEDIPVGLVPPGTRYGLRVDGDGHNHAKLLQDPWSLAFDGTVDWLSHPGTHRLADPTDTASLVPRSVAVDQSFDWGDDAPPRTSWTDTIVYEVHVKGATATHPGVPEHLRGTYAGFCHPTFIAHLVSLGVTAVELLPIHQIVPEERLAALGLTNYWGYNTLGFFAPHQGYASDPSQVVRECKGMIKLLHEAGIEVLLDVVYNHTCEAGPGGAALFLRGLDPDGWYRGYDTTGCGNSLDVSQPLSLQLVMDSLRYWVNEFHVDGFRFDLAATIARGANGSFDGRGSFLTAISQDPVLSKVKLIAEAWDVGAGGYQVGSFPAPWAEWNDRYRDLIRDHWRNAPRPLGAVARRIAGNSDVFSAIGRKPWSSINFVTAHDGFTLADLVSYNDKHNAANGEDGRDGTSDNRSWNHGVEGPTDDPGVMAMRSRTQRNILASLFLSQGTPMLVAGDEFGRTQGGNNNAYCLDNETSWLNWNHVDQSLLDFTRALISLRKSSPVFCQREWLTDEDAQWFAPDGEHMSIKRWDDPDGVGLQLLLLGDGESNDRLMVLHEDLGSQHFVLPKGDWTLVFSTDLPGDPAIDVSDGTWMASAPVVAVFRRS
jgi:isoamylase